MTLEEIKILIAKGNKLIPHITEGSEDIKKILDMAKEVCSICEKVGITTIPDSAQLQHATSVIETLYNEYALN